MDKREITYVMINDEEIPISSSQLDRFCNDDGDLVIDCGDGNAIVIEDWFDLIRVQETVQ